MEDDMGKRPKRSIVALQLFSVVLLGVATQSHAQTETYFRGCAWRGTAPICQGSCERTERQVGSRDRYGATPSGRRGNRCVQGFKRFCCRIEIASMCTTKTIHTNVMPAPTLGDAGAERCDAGQFLGTQVPELVAGQDNTWQVRCCRSRAAAGLYKIRNRQSGKLLAVMGRQTDNGADVVQWQEERDQPDKVWELAYQNPDDGLATLRNRHSGKLLAVEANIFVPLTNVILWERESDAARQPGILWRPIGTASGDFKFLSHRSAQVLAVKDASVENGGDVVLYNDENQPDIHWELIPTR